MQRGQTTMIVNLYNNESPANKISKSVTLLAALEGQLVNETNVVAPVIRIYNATFPAFNYAQIPLFNRYYFLRDVRQIRNDVWEISLESDALMSFNIGSVSGIVMESASGGSEYLEHRHFVRNVKSKTDIIPFSSGLLDSGEYILITAGGGA